MNVVFSAQSASSVTFHLIFLIESLLVKAVPPFFFYLPFTAPVKFPCQHLINFLPAKILPLLISPLPQSTFLPRQFLINFAFPHFLSVNHHQLHSHIFPVNPPQSCHSSSISPVNAALPLSFFLRASVSRATFTPRHAALLQKGCSDKACHP